jgi:fluoride exporter
MGQDTRIPGWAALDVVAAVAAGGMLGSSARYGVARWLPPVEGTFPWATFWTNLAGSLLLGVLVAAVLPRLAGTRLASPFAATGILGAFTTLSTFQVETALLLRGGHNALAAAYLLTSIAGGLGCAAVGIVVGLPRGSAASDTSKGPS